MKKRLAKISKATLQKKENGILFFWVFVDYEEMGSQGIGGIALDDYDKDKIVISKKGYLMPYIDDTHDYTYSDNFKIIVDNKKNLKNILKIIDSCLVKYLIKQFSKHGFDNINALELLNEKIDDDKDIYKLYNLTENEKNHINYITNC